MKKDKYAFFKDKVEYLGHKISSEELHTAPKKVEAIKAAPTPSNVQELRLFLGLLYYYGTFIPDLATLDQVYPMNKLLQAKTTWNRTEECDKAFTLAKEKLTSATILAHYNPKYPLRLVADPSSYGLEAVISHIFPNSVKWPITYASRTLTAVQLKRATNYDPILSKVLLYTKQGWPDKVDEPLKPYWNRRAELTLEDDCNPSSGTC